MARVLVIGKYSNNDNREYILRYEDGNIFQVIREYEEFYIDNQMRGWMPVPTTTRSGKTILVCKKFNDWGEVIEEFPLPHNKKGLWALSSGSARNGVFHNYREPTTELEKVLSEMGYSPKIVEKIDTAVQLTVGGNLCSHCCAPYGYWFVTDGKRRDLTEPKRYPEDGLNIAHRGCIEGYFEEEISDFSFVIYYNIDTYMGGSTHKTLEKIFIKDTVDENTVIEKIKNKKNFTCYID